VDKGASTYHLPSKWLMARIRMMLRVSALPWLTFRTGVRSNPIYVNCCTVLVLPWGVSIPWMSGGGLAAFSMAGIEKEKRDWFQLEVNSSFLFWHVQDCSSWNLKCIRYLWWFGPYTWVPVLFGASLIWDLGHSAAISPEILGSRDIGIQAITHIINEHNWYCWVRLA